MAYFLPPYQQGRSQVGYAVGAAMFSMAYWISLGQELINQSAGQASELAAEGGFVGAVAVAAFAVGGWCTVLMCTLAAGWSTAAAVNNLR